MKTTKRSIYYLLAACAIFIGVTLASCEKDGSDDAPTGSITGTWKGTNGTWTCEFDFNSDGTGAGEGDDIAGSHYDWRFTYTHNGSTITCKGEESYTGSDGQMDFKENKTFRFTLNGSQLTGGPFSGMTYSKR